MKTCDTLEIEIIENGTLIECNFCYEIFKIVFEEAVPEEESLK
jgi:hypothetical protein